MDQLVIKKVKQNRFIQDFKNKHMGLFSYFENTTKLDLRMFDKKVRVLVRDLVLDQNKKYEIKDKKKYILGLEQIRKSINKK
ncbi:hypothetical protein NBO_597g0003 [Nosema bombycis CQ1]|uniref:Uncharacterized protein n=1 Tax=Nosema bombycis (strain CQ1 / CVCC 102059) TaxID=578461 RepID=R0MGU9_NOSB1|nr:hypothetical protein NBO_597g0003 [Nosema bombycis CQ1]|eukprot:EOB11998.1 hypothetical protein NBO_597g0003 [Nosema bombycis CQ1]